MMRIIPAAGAVLCSLAFAVAAFAQPQGDVARGKELYMTDKCYTCHGTRGAGGGIAGPKLAPNPLPLEAIMIQLRQPASRMPPYSPEVISDAQIADIYGYLKSIPVDKPASEIPLLR
jgi:mono/diheme cytochrome c family protein